MMAWPVIRASSLLDRSDNATTYVFSIDEYFTVSKLALLCAQCSQVKSYFLKDYTPRYFVRKNYCRLLIVA